MPLAVGLQRLTAFLLFRTLCYVGAFVMAIIDLSFFNRMISVSSLKPLISKSLSVRSVRLKVGM